MVKNFQALLAELGYYPCWRHDMMMMMMMMIYVSSSFISIIFMNGNAGEEKIFRLAQ